MKDFPSLDETLDLWLLQSRIVETVHKARERELAEYGLTRRQAAVLHIVQDIGGVAKPAEISRWLFRKHHSIHELLQRMEKARLVRKINDPARKKGVRVVLTDKGRKVCYQVSGRESIRRIFSSLAKEERKQLSSYLKVLLDRSRKEIGLEDKLPLRPSIPSGKTVRFR